MGCAASTHGGTAVAGGDGAQAGNHPSSPTAVGATAQGNKADGSPATVQVTKASDPSSVFPAPGEAKVQRGSSTVSVKSGNEGAAEVPVNEVSKGKVSDATFGSPSGAAAERSRTRSQEEVAPGMEDADAPEMSRVKSEGGERGLAAGSTPTRGRGPKKESVDSRQSKGGRLKRMFSRHTLETAPGAQGVVRITEWVTGTAGRRGNRNVIESKPERIQNKSHRNAAPMGERSLDKTEAKFLADVLSTHWLFEKFSDHQYDVLLRGCEALELAEATPLILQGAEDDGRMYILHRGQLSVHVLDKKAPEGAQSPGPEGKEPAGEAPPTARQPTERSSAHSSAESADQDRGSDAPKPPSAKDGYGMHVATVLTGGWVGDMALLYKTTRTATVVAEVDCRVLAVPRLAYETAMAESNETTADPQDPNEFAEVPVLQSVKDSKALGQLARTVTWGEGEVVLEAGTGAREMLVILNGDVTFENGSGAAPAAPEYRQSSQAAFTSSERLSKGDVVAGGRSGDEALLVVLHNSGIKVSAALSSRKLKLAGGLPYGAARAIATTAGKGLRFYLQDIVTNQPLLEPLVESLDGIRAVIQCTPSLAKQLKGPALDAAAFVMQPMRVKAGAPIPVHAAADKNQGHPVMVLVSGKVAVRRSDDVAIRSESGEASASASAPTQRSSQGSTSSKPSEDGIIGRMYDVMTSINAPDQPSVKYVTKTPVTMVSMTRADHEDISTRHEGFSGVRLYPPKRPASNASLFQAKGAPAAAPGAEGNVLLLEDLAFERKIGQGAYGAVYLAVHRPTGRTVATKIIKLARLRKHHKDDAINLERHVMQDSDNPFIVSLYATFKTRTHLLLVMEAGMGGELFSFLLRQEHQVLHEDSVRFYGACVLSALAAMHEDGYMYRDLKPENVVITADGYAKIVDFGFAKRTAARTFTVCGTNAYLSPEMLTVQGHNFEVDYWAFGVFLYEMAIGCASFNVEADGTMNHEMPPFQVCQNILNPKYRLRFDIGVYPVSPQLQDVITQLLEHRVEHRIGCRIRGAQELMEHPFFAPIDFDKLKRSAYAPPWNPELKDGLDTRYFENTHRMRKSELIAFGIGDGY